jgi:hypothetical protein
MDQKKGTTQTHTKKQQFSTKRKIKPRVFKTKLSLAISLVHREWTTTGVCTTTSLYTSHIIYLSQTVNMEIIGHSNGARRSERGGQGHDGDRGANHSREGRRRGTLNERDRGDRTNSGNSQQKDFRAKSYQQSKKILGSFLNNKQQIFRSADAAAFINTIFNLNPVDSVVQVTKDCTRLSIFKTAICSLDGPHIQLVFRLLNYLATMCSLCRTMLC